MSYSESFYFVFKMLLCHNKYIREFFNVVITEESILEESLLNLNQKLISNKTKSIQKFKLQNNEVFDYKFFPNTNQKILPTHFVAYRLKYIRMEYDHSIPVCKNKCLIDKKPSPIKINHKNGKFSVAK